MKSPVLFQNQPAVEISDSQNKILISPDRGARLLRWERNGQEIITWPETADWSNLNKVRGGNPVLFPFLARSFVDAKLGYWRDKAGTVRSMPQHGFARDSKFTVIADGVENSVRMRLTDSEKMRAIYPFKFKFDVTITLLPSSRLKVGFETTNTGDQLLPYYAGHHFYLALPHKERADWTLDLPCKGWATQTSEGFMYHKKVGTSLLRLDDVSMIDRFQIEPSNPNVTLQNTKTRRKLVFELTPPGSIPWYAVTTWTMSPESDFYCVEPWLGLPNAIHHGEGLRWVAPGKMEVATCILDGSGW